MNGTDEKPLHVRVAEALGWRNSSEEAPGIWAGFPPNANADLSDSSLRVPRYDTDWSATGPLIERYRFRLNPPSQPDGEEPWCLWDAEQEDTHAEDPSAIVNGDTPLLVVCNLILALSAAGKLK